jgi:hypothetical protein
MVLAHRPFFLTDEYTRVHQGMVQIANTSDAHTDAIALHLISRKGGLTRVYILQAVHPKQERSI